MNATSAPVHATQAEPASCTGMGAPTCSPSGQATQARPPSAFRVAFAGTPEFASCALDAIVQAGFSVPLVLTQPDRPAGRGLKLQASAVKQTAHKHQLSVAQPNKMRELSAADADILAHCDTLVVAAYGLILPQWVLDLPRHGCINIHASLLPRWRGAAPIQRAIEAGDPQTGITIMQMDVGLDTGAMLRTGAIPISDDTSAASLHDPLAALGAQLCVQVLHDLAAGRPLLPQAQPSEGVCYAHKLSKEEAQLDWTAPATLLARRVRAFNPVPVCKAKLAGQDGAEDEVLKIWSAQALPAAGPAAATVGQIVALGEAGIDVLCGAGSMLRLTELQRAGGKRMPAATVARGLSLHLGQHFVL